MQLTLQYETTFQDTNRASFRHDPQGIKNGDINGTHTVKVIADYIAASNAHDVEAILACFSEQATVRDEGNTIRGANAIKVLV